MRRLACSVAALLTLSGAFALARGQCSVPPGSPPLRPVWLTRIAQAPAASAGGGSAGSVGGAVIAEREPNDATTSAQSVALGDSVQGTVGLPGDRDFYAVELAAGTRLDLKVLSIENRYRTDSRGFHSTLTLLDANGQAITTSVYDYFDHAASEARIRWKIERTGRYFVVVAAYQPSYSDPAFQYSLTLREFVAVAPGPGDPTTLFAAVGEQVIGMVAGRSGDLFVSDNFGRLLHISATKRIRTIATVAGAVGGLAMDRSGNLLVPACEYPQGVLWRISPTGEKTRLVAASKFSPFALAVGPDGDIWIGNSHLGGEPHIMRFSESGALKQAIHLADDYYPGEFVFSPSGELHFISYNGLYKLVRNETPQHLTADWIVNGVFDRDGYLYGRRTPVRDGEIVRMILMDPQYRIVGDPFAVANDYFDLPHLSAIVFLRDAHGAMTRRLLVARTLTPHQLQYEPDDQIREINPEAVRAPGFGYEVNSGGDGGRDPLVIDSAALRSGTVGTIYRDTLRTSGGAAHDTVTWRITTGALPPGLALATSGIISGTPTSQGAFAFTVEAKRADTAATRGFRITIDPSAGGGTDSTNTPVPVTVEQVTQALLGQGTLSPAAAEFLDRQGNHNGQVDLGDLRAFLRARGLLPSPGKSGKP